MVVKKILICAILLTLCGTIRSFPFRLLKMDEAFKPTFSNDGKTNGEYLVVKSLIKKFDVVFDVGANCGEYTLNLIELGIPLKIYVFEPIHEMAVLFDHRIVALSKQRVVAKGNLSKNQINAPLVDFVQLKNETQISIFELALGKCDGLINFYRLNDKVSELSSCYLRECFKRIPNIVITKTDVACMTIDSFCKTREISYINFLKIDTEGNESAILAGAYNMLKNNAIDYIQFEYGGTYLDAKTTLKQICKDLTNFGYIIFKIHSDGVVYIDRWTDGLEDYGYSNYLAVAQKLGPEFRLMRL